MINLIKTPQRADFKALYEIKGDVLTVTIGDVKEVFDFTGVSEGIAEEITPEKLIINPIIRVEKTGDNINISVIEFYSKEDATKYELQMEIEGTNPTGV